jgi:hypothetical protein
METKRACKSLRAVQGLDTPAHKPGSGLGFRNRKLADVKINSDHIVAIERNVMESIAAGCQRPENEINIHSSLRQIRTIRDINEEKHEKQEALCGQSWQTYNL